jgi:WD40 repeat protein
MQPLIISGANPPLLAAGAPLPARMAPLFRNFEMKHTGPVNGLAVLPGGKYLLSAGADRHIRVWDMATGKEIKVFDGTPHVVRSLAVNGIGNAAATGGDDGAIRVWDVAAGREAFNLTGHAGPVRGVAFSPNGMYVLSGGQDGTLRLWDLQAREAVRELKLGQPITCVAFCPDGRRALAGGDSGTVAFFDLEAAHDLHTVTGHIGAAVTAVAFSRDGREAVSIGDDHKLHIWDVVRGTKLPLGSSGSPTAIGYSQPPQAVAYVGDGSWVIAAMPDFSAALVQPHGKGRARISLPPFGKTIALAVAPDGSAVYFGADQGAIRRMDFQGGANFVATGAATTDPRQPEPTPAPTPVPQKVSPLTPKWTADAGAANQRTLAVAANGRAVTGGSDRTVHIWDPDGKEIRSFGNMSPIENNVAISKDGGTILVGGNGPTQVGRVLVAADCLLRSVATKTGKVTIVGAHLSPITCVALSPNGRYALTGCQTVVRYWDAASSRELRQYFGHAGIVRAVGFHPKLAQAVSVAADNTAKIWDLDGTKLIRTIADLPGMPTGVAFSPDGKLILIWGAGVFGTWDASTGKQVAILSTGPGRQAGGVATACWTPNGNILIAGGAGVRLIDAATGKDLRQFAGAPLPVDAVGVSADGKFVLAAGRGLCAWELEKPLIPGADVSAGGGR